MSVVVKALNKFTSLEGELFRYALSYSLLLALFPCLFLLVYLLQNSIIKLDEVLQFLYLFIPDELIAPLIDFLLVNDHLSFMSTIYSLCISIGVASQVFYSFLIICTKDEQFNLSLILIRIQAIFLFIVFILAWIFIIFCAIIFPLPKGLTISISLFIFFMLFYHLVSYRKRKITESLLGAIFSTISILLLGLLFFWIIKNFTNFDGIYGPLSSVAILLLSIYVISNIVYFGYCLNVCAFTKDYYEYRFSKFYSWFNHFKRTRK